jgi:hypothetical protein
MQVSWGQTVWTSWVGFFVLIVAAAAAAQTPTSTDPLSSWNDGPTHAGGHDRRAIPNRSEALAGDRQEPALEPPLH